MPIYANTRSPTAEQLTPSFFLDNLLCVYPLSVSFQVSSDSPQGKTIGHKIQVMI